MTIPTERLEYLRAMFEGIPQNSINHEMHRDAALAITELLAARDALAALTKALAEIAEGRGAFSRDPLTHAENTIDSMKEIARAALAATEGDPPDEPHNWVPPKGPISWEHCGRCGIVKRTDGKNSKVCKGTPRIGPRAATEGGQGGEK